MLDQKKKKKSKVKFQAYAWKKKNLCIDYIFVSYNFLTGRTWVTLYERHVIMALVFD